MICTKCKKEKGNNFYKRRKKCKDCVIEYQKIYTQKHKKEIEIAKKLYRQNNKEKINLKNKKYQKEYYKKNKERRILQIRKWQRNNKEKRNLSIREYARMGAYTLSNNYIKKLIKDKSTLSSKDIPAELISVYRLNLTLKRLTRKKKIKC